MTPRCLSRNLRPASVICPVPPRCLHDKTRQPQILQCERNPIIKPPATQRTTGPQGRLQSAQTGGPMRHRIAGPIQCPRFQRPFPTPGGASPFSMVQQFGQLPLPRLRGITSAVASMLVQRRYSAYGIASSGRKPMPTIALLAGAWPIRPPVRRPWAGAGLVAWSALRYQRLPDCRRIWH